MKTYRNVSYQDVQITGGFWKNRQELNASVTAQAIYDRFSESHRFEALDCVWREDFNYKPHIFWDSDIAKWIEGAAYILSQKQDDHLLALCENAIDKILQNQTKEGYFNSYYLATEQHMRFKFRGNHELYCAGHLIEAACAYYEATGRDRFLKAMCQYADYIYDTFVVYQCASFVTGGHPEIELALVRLYETVGEEKYLFLAGFFLDARGNNSKDATLESLPYILDHMPLARQREAMGHCVRAMYLYSAMADIARCRESDEYLEACRALYQDTVNKKMYITGGIGSAAIGESFAAAYFLPNSTAYTETCAAIGLALFCKRMMLLSEDSSYADTIERILYNGFLSGISLDGKAFFYTNPLEIDPAFADVNISTSEKRFVPAMQRVELFNCSCCPPNVLRFIASVGNLLYTYDEQTLFVHQFMNSEATVNGVRIRQTTAYPADGALTIAIEGSAFQQIAVRIPAWCSSFHTSQPYTVKNGYACFPACPEIRLTFHMPVKLWEAHPAVQNNAGRVAVTRGPIVYCLEGIDNGSHLRSLSLRPDGAFTLEDNDEYQVPVLLTQGLRKRDFDGLYRTYAADAEPAPLRFIPYFAFANRGISEMTVWVPVSPCAQNKVQNSL